MVNSNESPMHMARLLGLKNATSLDKRARIWAIRLFSSMSPQVEFNRIAKFEGPTRKAIFLELLKLERISLERSEERVEMLMMPALEGLLREFSQEIDVLDLTGLLAVSPQYNKIECLEEALVCMQDYFLFDLRAFSVLGEKYEISNHFDRWVVLGYFELLLISTRNQLEMLRIEVSEFDLADFLKLSKSFMPELRFLSIRIASEFALPTEEELVVSFPRLKVFLFRTEAPKERSSALKHLCWGSLPNLQVARDFASDFCTQLHYHYAPHKSDASNLRHMDLDLSYETAQEDVHLLFPHVTHLKISNLPDADVQIDRLLLFNGIESLHLSCLSSKVVVRFLEKYGNELLSLSLDQFCDECTYNRIFFRCPKLERLGMPTRDRQTEISGYDHLKEIRLDTLIVSNILFAPELEQAVFYNHQADVEDLRATTALITGMNRIPRNLESLVIDLHCVSISDVNQSYFKAVVEFIKAIGVSVPTLSSLRFKLNPACDYLILAMSMRLGKLWNADFAGVTLFFEAIVSADNLALYSWFTDDDLMTLLEKFI